MNLNGADLTGASYDGTTQWPDGFDPDAAGATEDTGEVTGGGSELIPFEADFVPSVPAASDFGRLALVTLLAACAVLALRRNSLVGA